MLENWAKEKDQTKREESDENETTQVERICEKLPRDVRQDEPNTFMASTDNTREQENKIDKARQPES